MAHQVYPGVGISSFWSNAADDEAVFDFHMRATAALTTAAQAKGLNYDFLYVNDADPVQKPFNYYGKGRSLQRMRRVAKKYGTSSLPLEVDITDCDLATRPLWCIPAFKSGHLETRRSRHVASGTQKAVYLTVKGR